jgi:hypothetical protein
VQQKSNTGGGDSIVKGPEQVGTNVAGEKKDMAAGAKTATSVDNEVASDLGEKEVLVASKNAEQKPETKSLMEERTQLQVEVITPLTDQTRKLPMV